MKYFSNIIIILLLSIIPIISQTNDFKTYDDKLNKIEKKLIQIENNVSTKSLEHQIKLANETFSSYNSLFSIYSWLFGILIALLAILVPALIYFFGIRPTKKATEKLDEKFQEYISEYELNKMEKAILDLDSDKNYKRQMAFNYIKNNYQYPFRDNHLLTFFNYLNTNEIINIDNRSILQIALLQRKSKYADQYFINNFNKQGRHSAMYFMNAGFIDYLDLITNNIIEGKIDLNELTKWIFENSISNFFELQELINFEKLINNFDKIKLTEFYQSIDKYGKIRNNNHIIDFKNSYLYKKCIQEGVIVLPDK